MKKPSITILIISGALVLYGIQVMFYATGQHNTISLNYVWATFAFIAAAGLILGRPWSQYLVYLFATTMSVQWVYVVWLINRKGWRYDDVQSNLISLIPGILLIIACVCSSIYVFRYFRRMRET